MRGFLRQVALAARLEKALQFDRDVEVILDRVLAAAGDDDDVWSPAAAASSTPY
jgi:hypothetical protein